MISARSKPGGLGPKRGLIPCAFPGHGVRPISGPENTGDGAHLVKQGPGSRTRVAKVYVLVLVAALFAWPASAQESAAPVQDPVAQAVGEKPGELNPRKEGAAGAGTIIPPELWRPWYRQESWINEPPLSEVGEPVNTVLRLGGWHVDNRGSPVKTGEYQGLVSSFFWEIDGLYSNGYRTLGIYGNQTDNISYQGHIHYFGPNLFADFDYQRFIHRLDHDSLDIFLPTNDVTVKTQTPPTTGYPGSKSLASKTTNNAFVLGQDLNVGEDYAIRVEEFRGSIGDRINDHLRFRVDVWDMRKFGERQANAVAHCFKASAEKGVTRGCHVLSQSQHIDWHTTEVTPRLEGRYGPVTIEYSRPMRQFRQNDEVVERDYQRPGGQLEGTYPYAIVPENTTQIDQIRGSIDLGPTRQLYAFGYVGNTENHNRDFDRDFNGYDVRFTDWTIPRTSVTLYFRGYNQTGTLPTKLLPDETDTGPKGESQPLPKTTPETPPEDYIALPLNFHRNTEGIKASWRPNFHVGLFRDVAFTTGYEHDFLNRENAIWQTPPRGPAAGQLENSGETAFSQENTTIQTLFVGVSKPWNWNFDTFARYKVLFVDNPLLGIRQLNGVVNTNQPELKHIVEFGGGWYPRHDFAITVQQDIEVANTHIDNNDKATGNIVDFGEQSYATTVTMWYALTPRLSMIGAASFYSNWINQNIFLGDNYFDGDEPPSPATSNLPLATQPTFYAGRSEVYDFYLNYRLTDTVWLTGGYQFVRGRNQFSMNGNPSFAFPPSSSTTEPLGTLTFADLPQYSRVLVETSKFRAGINWRPLPRTTISVLYDYYDYEDETISSNSGTAHMVFAGLSRVW